MADGDETNPSLTSQQVIPPPESQEQEALTPQDLLKAEQAKQDLQRLQLRQVADLIPVLRQMIESVLNRMDAVLKETQKVLQQAVEIHELMLQDATATMEILRVYQSQLVILEQVKQDSLSADGVKQEPTGTPT